MKAGRKVKKMIPKIEFRYSQIYDEGYRNSKKIAKFLKERNKKYPSYEKLISFSEKVDKYWKEKGRKILKEISKVFELKWKEKKITCYIIGVGKPFSDPLTIGFREKIKDFGDTLTHELIHQIQIQNKLKLKKWFDYVYKEYEKEDNVVKNHILLDAILYKVLENIYDKKRLNKIIKSDSRFEDYKRAWEIVKKETPERIIKKFKEISKQNGK